MNQFEGAIVDLPKVSASVPAQKGVSGNVGAKIVNIGEDGATFIPDVSAEGVISWSNDKDLPNPEPVNIKGEKGDTGKAGYTPIKGIDYFDGQDGYTPVKGKDYFDGVDGKDGLNGKDGYTPKKGVDYFDGKDGVSGVYVGSGDMPDGYNVQIDPNGSATDIVDLVIANLPIYDGEVETV